MCKGTGTSHTKRARVFLTVPWAAVGEPLSGKARPRVDSVHAAQRQGALAVRCTAGAGWKMHLGHLATSTQKSE